MNSDVPALEHSRLLWVQQNYIRDETLTRANERLVAAQADLPLAQLWGGGDIASADGQRFRVPVETLNADYSWKYFGEGKGITYARVKCGRSIRKAKKTNSGRSAWW